MRKRDLDKARAAAGAFLKITEPVARRLGAPLGGVTPDEIAMAEDKAMDLYDALKPLMRLYHDTTFAA
ncbi:MAG: hypothetical protein DCC73_11540 [Proteobacteria bacterium]|nr:MAG: hypothetical protein DCC73_11540 [Pseudomonadota bacterium]